MARISKNQLVKLQKRYHTDRAIGKLYGITRQAVHQLRAKHGLPPVADRHADRDSQIIRFYVRGVPGPKLARRFGLSLSQIYRIVRGSRTRSAENPSGRAA
jgi:hypothetical protein